MMMRIRGSDESTEISLERGGRCDRAQPLGVKNTLNGGDIPVAWINSKYRMVYLNYGHGDRIYSTPILPAMIDNSLRFLLDSPR